MFRTISWLVLSMFFVLSVGCGKVGGKAGREAARQIGKWLSKAPKDGLTKGAKELEKNAAKTWQSPAAKRLEDSATRNLEKTAARAPHVPLAPVGPAASAAALQSREILAQSRMLGQRLANVRARMPSAVYARLLQQWQRNHAEIETCHNRLQDPTLDSYERQSVHERIVAATERNAEIERLVAQYG